jgi:hypothetical protein
VDTATCTNLSRENENVPQNLVWLPSVGLPRYFFAYFLATFAISEKSFTRKPHGNSLKKTANVNIYNGSS